MRFPHLAHRSAAAHKLHSTPQQHAINLISGNRETSSRLPAYAYSSPEAVQTTGTVANRFNALVEKLVEKKEPKIGSEAKPTEEVVEELETPQRRHRLI